MSENKKKNLILLWFLIDISLIFAFSSSYFMQDFNKHKQMNSHDNVACHLHWQKIQEHFTYTCCSYHTFPLESNEQTKFPCVFHACGWWLSPCRRACVHTDLSSKVADRWALSGSEEKNKGLCVCFKSAFMIVKKPHNWEKRHFCLQS